jgi:hypothetical protein
MRSIMIGSLVALLVALPVTALRAGTVQRGYGAGNFALEIGAETRFVQSVEGGVVRGVVAADPSGDKRITGVVVDPIRAKIGSDDFAQFVNGSLSGDGKTQPVNGVVHMTDLNFKSVDSREFTNAVLTEVTLPTLDGASKEQVALTIVLQPESVRARGGQGNVVGGGKIGTSAKRAVASAFRVTIPGMDTQRVAKIDEITASRKAAGSTPGEQRDLGQSPPPGQWQVSNIVIQVPQQYAKDFVTWHDDFVIKGNNGADRERTMTIEVLDATLQQTLMTVTLSGVGIIAVSPVPAEAGSDAIARSRVELYAEKLTLAGGGKPAAADASAQSPATAAPAPAATESPTRIQPVKPAAPVGVEPAAPTRRRPR